MEISELGSKLSEPVDRLDDMPEIEANTHPVDDELRRPEESVNDVTVASEVTRPAEIVNVKEHDANQQASVTGRDIGASVHEATVSPGFPEADLELCLDMMQRKSWVVPVQNDKELDKCMLAALRLAKAEEDQSCAACVRFYKDALQLAFSKTFMEDAVSNWSPFIRTCIAQQAKRFAELCAIKLTTFARYLRAASSGADDERLRELLNVTFTLLDVLAIVFNPRSHFHTECASEAPFKPSPSELGSDGNNQTPFVSPYARAGTGARAPYGHLCDMVHRFGTLGGFEAVVECVTLVAGGADRAKTPTWELVLRLRVALCAALLRPIGLVYEYLTPTALRYCAPLADPVVTMLETLSDGDVRREARMAAAPATLTTSVSVQSVSSAGVEAPRSEAVNVCVRALRCILVRLSEDEQQTTVVTDTGAEIKQCLLRVDTMRFAWLVRVLELASFTGKMGALNEINRLIANTQSQSQSLSQTQSGSVSVDAVGGLGRTLNSLRLGPVNAGSAELAELEDSFTANELARWLGQSKLVEVALRENMHQPQYVEKLERLVRFLAKERALDAADLDRIWATQAGGRHEAIVKNVHDLLAKLAWDLSPPQLDQLFSLFQRSWQLAAGNRKLRERLLEFIRRLAEDDKQNVLVERVLELLFELARSPDCAPDIVTLALAAQTRILDYFALDRQPLKLLWLQRFVVELVNVTRRHAPPVSSDPVTLTTEAQVQVHSSSTTRASFFEDSHWTVVLLGHTLQFLNLLQEAPYSNSLLSRPDASTAAESIAVTGNDETCALPTSCSRSDAIVALNSRFALLGVVIENLCCYMHALRTIILSNNSPLLDTSQSSSTSGVFVSDDSFAASFSPDGRLTHAQHVAERLRFLSFVLGNAPVVLTEQHCARLWRALAVEGVCSHDRDACFRWLADLVVEHERNGGVFSYPVLAAFFESSLLKYDAALVTVDGFICFERLFRLINLRQGKISMRHTDVSIDNTSRPHLQTVVQDPDLVGFDFLWRVLLDGPEQIAPRCARLIKDIYSHLVIDHHQSTAGGGALLDVHQDFLSTCYDRLKAYFDTLTVLAQNGAENSSKKTDKQHKNDDAQYILRHVEHKQSDANGEQDHLMQEIGMHANDSLNSHSSFSSASQHVGQKEQERTVQHEQETAMHRQQIDRSVRGLSRVLSLVLDYVTEHERAFQRQLERGDEQRSCVPLQRASVGYRIVILFKFVPAAATGSGMTNVTIDDLEVRLHNNALVQTLRNLAAEQLRTVLGPTVVVHLELLHADETLDSAADLTTIGSLLGAAQDRAELVVRFQTATRIPHRSAYSDSSSEDEHADETFVANRERALPGCLLAADSCWIPFLLQIGQLSCHLRSANVRDAVLQLLRILPSDQSLSHSLRSLFDFPLAATIPASLELPRAHCFELVYSLELLVALLLPTPVRSHDATKEHRLQAAFIRAGGLHACSMLLKFEENNLLSEIADSALRTLVYARLVRLLKLTLSCTFMLVRFVCTCTVHDFPAVIGGFQWSPEMVSQISRALGVCMQSTTLVDDLLTSEHVVHLLEAEIKVTTLATSIHMPDLTLIRTLYKLLWTTCNSYTELASTDATPEQDAAGDWHMTDDELMLVRDAFDCLTLAVLAAPGSFDALRADHDFQKFVIDVLLVCRSRIVRNCAFERLQLLALNSFGQADAHQTLHENVLFLITLLAAQLPETVRQHAAQSCELFELLTVLLQRLRLNHGSPPKVDALLDSELLFLRQIRDTVTEAARASGALQVRNLLSPTDEQLLAGHLNVARELVTFLDEPRKAALGSSVDGPLLLRDLLDNFLFPAAKLLLLLQQAEAASTPTSPAELMRSVSPVPVCASGPTQAAAYDLVLALCEGCTENGRYVAARLTQLFYTQTQSRFAYAGSSASAARKAQLLDTEVRLTEWDYIPAVGAHSFGGFVGLKNGGATCYMNAVLQQMFMIRQVRNYLLSIDLSPRALTEAFMRAAAQSEHAGTPSPSYTDAEACHLDCLDDEELIEEYGLGATLKDSLADPLKPLTFSPAANTAPLLLSDARLRQLLQAAAGGNAARASTIEYNLAVLKQLQTIFGHLNYSRLQFYVPKGFWRIFRLSGEQINLREQHDAVEFLNNVEDAVDEACKFLGRTPVVQHVCGGTLADQKICRGCPHRYSREDPFLVLNVDVRNHPNLLEALAEYVKGDLLEGPNAYWCELCQRKVDAVKRSVIARLPTVLVIQLKRFDYDYEREMPVKFNDYFEFPRMLDLEPYTVDGLARLEHTPADADALIPVANDVSACTSVETKYRLVGIAVHSGQANGGHYYSYILNRGGSTHDADGNASAAPAGRWYKFDDNDVTECNMDKDDELRAQCFGGDFASDAYDNVLKRVTPRKQKRSWNAYMLFYERLTPAAPTTVTDTTGAAAAATATATRSVDESLDGDRLRLPPRIEQVILLHNLKLAHARQHFSIEYCNFIRQFGAIDHERLAQLLNSPNEDIVPYVASPCATELPPESRILAEKVEQHTMVVTEIMCRYLFTSGFRTKKSLRGAASEYLDSLALHLRISWRARAWFAEHILFAACINSASANTTFTHQTAQQLYARFIEYLVECPVAEVRATFAKLLNVIAQSALQYGDVVTNESPLSQLIPSIIRGYSQFEDPKRPVLLSDVIVISCLNMLKAGLVSASTSFGPPYSSSYDYSTLQSGASTGVRQLQHFFNLLFIYGSHAASEREHLIQIGAPIIFVRYLLDKLDPPATSSSYYSSPKRPPESVRLYASISCLVRSCSVAHRCKSLSQEPSGANSLENNPYSEWSTSESQQVLSGPLMVLPDDLANWVYQATFVRRMIDDFSSQPPNMTTSKDIMRLMQFLAYENVVYSEVLLQELLLAVAQCHISDVRNIMLLLGHLVVNIEDSYRQSRLFMAFRGLTYALPREDAVTVNDSKVGATDAPAASTAVASDMAASFNSYSTSDVASTLTSEAVTRHHVEGILELIINSRTRHPKRAYLILKTAYDILSSSDMARNLLSAMDDFKQMWLICTSWLDAELAQRPAYASYGNYNTWNTNTLSNESSSSYYLEHSASASQLSACLRSFNEQCAFINEADANSSSADENVADGKNEDADAAVSSSSGEELAYSNNSQKTRIVSRSTNETIDAHFTAEHPLQSPSSRPPSPV